MINLRKFIKFICVGVLCAGVPAAGRADTFNEWGPFFGRTAMVPAITQITIQNTSYGRMAYKDAAGNIIAGVAFKPATNPAYAPDYGMPEMSGPIFYSPAIQRGAAKPIFFNLANMSTVADPVQLKTFIANYFQYFYQLNFITNGYGKGVFTPAQGGGSAVLQCPNGSKTTYTHMSATDAQTEILTPYANGTATFTSPKFGQVIKAVSYIKYYGTTVTIVNTGYVFNDPRGIFNGTDYLYEDSFYSLENGTLVPLQITGLVYPNNDRPPYYMAYSLSKPGAQLSYAINGPRFTFGYQQSGGFQGFDPGYPIGSWDAYIAAQAPDFESSFSSSGAIKMQRLTDRQIESAVVNHVIPLGLPTLEQLNLGLDPCT